MSHSYIDENTKKLIITHNAGFFSCCTVKLVEIISYFNKYHKTPEVDSSSLWNSYKDEVGDITNKLFKINNDDILFKQNIDGGHLNTQFSNFLTKVKLSEISDFIKKYFTPSEAVLQIEEHLIKKYNINLNKTIAVCYRGSDKKTETNLPTHLQMIQKVKLIKDKYPDYNILVQSDELKFYDLIKTLYPDIIFFDEIFKLTQEKNRAVQYYIPIGQKLQQAQLFLAIIQIISKSSKVITNSGNVGVWIYYYRNNPEGFYQYVSRYIHDINNVDTDYWTN